MTVNENTQIDPEKFAYHFATVARQMNYSQQDLIPEAKKFLLSYLTAYYLIGDFNTLEDTQFTNNKKLSNLSFDEMVDKIQQLNSKQMLDN